jgi:glycine oxidase
MPAATDRYDAAVIGGGIVGLACALELAGRDLTVVLIERRRTGAEASSAAAGLLQPFAEVLPPGPLLTASLEALALWPAWLAELKRTSGREVEYAEWGTLFVAWNEEEMDWIERTETAVLAAGHAARRLHPDAAAELVPNLPAHPVGALRLFSERRVDNLAACAAAVAACRAVDVHVIEELAVDAVDLGSREVALRCGERELRAERVVLAAGAWSGQIDGLPAFPVSPRRGQMICYRACDWPWSGCIRRGRRYALRRGADRLLVGSTVEDAGFDHSTTESAVTELKRFARNLFPALEGRQPAEAWAGLRPGTVDDLPLIGRWNDSPLWLATGHFRSGILLGPWTARRLADWITGETAEADNPFSPIRFGEPQA